MIRKPFTIQPSASGFTLLEIVIVLALLGLAIGGAVTYFVVNATERQFKNLAGDIEVLSKKARMAAIVQQTPYALTISSTQLQLAPLAEATDNELQRIERQQREEIQQAQQPQDTQHSFKPVRESLSFRGLEVAIRRWGAVNWARIDRGDVAVWRFDPNGLCEPIGLRFSEDRSWLSLDFHPLSAGIREQQMEAH